VDSIKDGKKFVPDASLISAQHIKTALASLFSQTSFRNSECIGLDVQPQQRRAGQVRGHCY